MMSIDSNSGRRNNLSARDSRAAATKEKALQALRLRRGGASFEQIAKELNTDKSTVYKWVKREIAAIPREAAEDVRVMELARLDTMFRAIWEKAAKGDGYSIERALRIMKRRAEYLGLDEPKTLTQVNVLLEKELNVTITTLEKNLDGDTFQKVLAALAAGARPEPPRLVFAESSSAEPDTESGGICE